MAETRGIPSDYRDRSYLSAIESAKYLGITVDELHLLVSRGSIPAMTAASGQMRFALGDLSAYESTGGRSGRHPDSLQYVTEMAIGDTLQRVINDDARSMSGLEEGAANLMVTSPPYFDAKMYSRGSLAGDLGDIHDIDVWFDEIALVWREVYRVLQPGRKAFVNIMNLPVRTGNGGFRSLNLAGRTIDLFCEIGFVFKRDIVWHKTNSVRAHFGTYPYPGGILINNAHEFILEFEKPAPRGYRKYAHISQDRRERSRIERDFWLSVKNSDVWTMHPEGSGDRRSHVAPFPLELPSRLIKAYSFVGETVLDPFMGSGTTPLAAAILGRNGIGFELSGEIASAALKRIAEYPYPGGKR